MENPFDDSPASAKVNWIYDGDTFQANIDNFNEKIRILNIDTYEASRGDRLNEQAAKAGISVDSALFANVINFLMLSKCTSSEHFSVYELSSSVVM